MSQRQDSLYDQLQDVYKAAVEIGCYDAADYIRRHVDHIRDAWLKEKAEPTRRPRGL